MTTRVLTTQVGTDGVLTLNLTLGRDDANRTVRVIIEPVAEAARPLPVTDRAGWLQFIAETGGSITDPTFERPAQGEYEQRDELP
jgi:hypothetical protein